MRVHYPGLRDTKARSPRRQQRPPRALRGRRASGTRTRGTAVYMLGVFGVVWEARNGRAGATLGERGAVLPALVLDAGCTASEAVALGGLAREVCGEGLPCVVWSEACGVLPNEEEGGLWSEALGRLEPDAVLEREPWEAACWQEVARALEVQALRDMLRWACGGVVRVLRLAVASCGVRSRCGVLGGVERRPGVSLAVGGGTLICAIPGYP